MGNLINIYANAAAQRAEKLSWIAVNIGYARSELDDLVDEKEPETPPELLSQLEASFENSIHELSEALAEERGEHEA
jgi:hypothetical protein